MQGVRTFYLSDRGIRQAVAQGILKFDPPLEDNQIQPVSVDLAVRAIDDVFPMSEAEEIWERFYAGLVIPPFANVTMLAEQEMQWMRPLKFQAELRSSLRRLGCYTPNGRAAPGRGSLEVEFNNFGPLEIQLKKGDKFAQLLFFFDERLLREDVPDVYPLHRDQKEYDLLMALDHGYQVMSVAEAVRLHMDGFFSAGKETHFNGAQVLVHAGKSAKLIRRQKLVDFSGKTDLSDVIEQVDLPYLILPGEHLVVDVEDLKLSPHIGIHFNEVLFPFGHFNARSKADSVLFAHFDGLVDPGYQGAFSRQPKTFYKQGIVIEPGQVLGHGRIIYFPNGVERPYGSNGLESHYQNSKGAKFLLE